MSSTTIFYIAIPLITLLLLGLNLLLAPHNPYKEKNSPFECGYHSWLGQNRSQFNISFFIFALVFLLFDLEILLIYPYAMSAYNNEGYGLVIMIIFFLLLTLGFVFEIGKKALRIEYSRLNQQFHADILNELRKRERAEILKSFSHIKNIIVLKEKLC